MAAHSKAGTSVSASMREGLGEVAEGVTGVEEEAMEEVEEVMAEEITDAIATEVMEIVIVMEIEGMEEEAETRFPDLRKCKRSQFAHRWKRKNRMRLYDFRS